MQPRRRARGGIGGLCGRGPQRRARDPARAGAAGFRGCRTRSCSTGPRRARVLRAAPQTSCCSGRRAGAVSSRKSRPRNGSGSPALEPERRSGGGTCVRYPRPRRLSVPRTRRSGAGAQRGTVRARRWRGRVLKLSPNGPHAGPDGTFTTTVAASPVVTPESGLGSTTSAAKPGACEIVVAAAADTMRCAVLPHTHPALTPRVPVPDCPRTHRD